MVPVVFGSSMNFNVAFVAMITFTQANDVVNDVVNHTSDVCPEPTENNTSPMSQV